MIESGGTILYGGDMDEMENYIGPTIIADLDPDHPALQEEVSIVDRLLYTFE